MSRMGQYVPAHAEPSPWYVPPFPVHVLWLTSVHVPLPAQQAPVATMQGFGEQEVPSPWYAPGSARQAA
ncbi:MAG: hypothetical protein AAB249_01530, partial [Acidobacteriota bacterium]